MGKTYLVLVGGENVEEFVEINFKNAEETLAAAKEFYNIQVEKRVEEGVVFPWHLRWDVDLVEVLGSTVKDFSKEVDKEKVDEAETEEEWNLSLKYRNEKMTYDIFEVDTSNMSYEDMYEVYESFMSNDDTLELNLKDGSMTAMDRSLVNIIELLRCE